MTQPAAARLRVRVSGAVQGVGFRPWVYRLATDLDVTGWITNDTRGVVVEAEGSVVDLHSFLHVLRTSSPSHAVVREVHHEWLSPAGYLSFEIRRSHESGRPTALVLPDIAPCPACLTELRDPADRRHGYAFINCTDCGPRFTIVRALPYDRARTTMAGFTLCAACTAEYADPRNRRFHAQPDACPDCGPHLAWWDASGNAVAGVKTDTQVIAAAATALHAGAILAVKGVGGYLLVCAANNDAAVRALRSSKHRPTKPLALMVANVTQVEQLCELCADEAAALSGPEAPIVLLRALPTAPVSSDVAPGNPWLGVMLPSSPLHHLLMDAFGGPLVATSGNRSDEPICIDERDALRRLAGIADFHLVHDRPIERHVDDSILARIDGSLRVLRRARGYAPLPLTLPSAVPTVLAVGAHLKNTIALSVGRDVFISQHIGDLETPEAQAAFERVIRDFLQFHDAQPLAIAHDLHPDIASTHWAQSAVSLPPLANGAGPIRRIAVQHHHAHLAACLAENGIEGPALGVIWDGTGYGTDGTIWGGEFMLGDASAYTRIAHLRPFALPGGEAAVREPRRSALALLHAVGAAHAATTLFSATELRTLMRMLDTGFRSPITTSAGRVFDGMAALLGLCTHAEFEGQAAMALEFAVDAGVRDAYPLPLRHGVLDWEDALRAALYDRQHEVPVGTIAARLHNALVDGAVAVARNVGQARVALSGGCFQNRLLTQRLATKLRSQGFDVLLHRRVPTNDGGISFGQIAVAAAVIARGGS